MKHHGLRAQVLSLRIALAKIGLTCMGLLCGASIGREGPTVHVGASIMYSLRHLKFLRGLNMSRGLILAGGAAGISAAFNTPLAGVMFAIEEMSRTYEDRTTGTLLIAVIIAGVTALAVLGNYTYFGSTSVHLTLREVWPAVLLCGIAGGLLGGLFSMALIHGSRRIAPLVASYPVRVAFACGVVLSLIGFLSGGTTYGTGYEEAKQLMAGEEAIAGFSLYKLLATVASYLSGIPGGIFAPSLSVGAGMGADMASLFSDIPLSGIVLLGMVGYFTGVVQTPITAFIIVMEMNDTPSMILPLMATALLAKGLSHLVCPTPIYQALADAYLTKTQSTTEERHHA
jgi:H+/Cl- antiporter ClcA